MLTAANAVTLPVTWALNAHHIIAINHWSMAASTNRHHFPAPLNKVQGLFDRSGLRVSLKFTMIARLCKCACTLQQRLFVLLPSKSGTIEAVEVTDKLRYTFLVRCTSIYSRGPGNHSCKNRMPLAISSQLRRKIKPVKDWPITALVNHFDKTESHVSRSIS